MKLHNIKHDYRAKLWCGIAALATITGKKTSECREAVLAVREKNYEANGFSASEISRHVTGMYNWELLGALKLMGFNSSQSHDYFNVPMKSRPTLAAWLKTRQQKNAVMVVNVTGHYVVISGRKFIDSRHDAPVPQSKAHCRRKKVKAAWVIERAA